MKRRVGRGKMVDPVKHYAALAAMCKPVEFPPLRPGFVRLWVPGWRPTLTNELIGKHPMTIARLKKQDVQVLDGALLEARVSAGRPLDATGKRRVHVKLRMTPAQRAPDPDAIWKSLLDALVKLRLLVDDSSKWCELGRFVSERATPAGTVIVLEDVA